MSEHCFFTSTKSHLQGCAEQSLLMKLFYRPIDLTNVKTVIYHLPDGPALSLKIDGVEDYLDFELEVGHVCDTSEIDGILHFFPKGNA